MKYHFVQIPLGSQGQNVEDEVYSGSEIINHKTKRNKGQSQYFRVHILWNNK